MKTLIIREIARAGEGLAEESLAFEEGLNVIVGRPNTGKTKWLQMLDYSFGSERPPGDVFGNELSVKYNKVSVTLEIDGVPLKIERRWNEPGNLSKVFVDGNSMPARDFCANLLSRLEIPLIHYPQGDPYGKRAWPELNWRSLFRHAYRRQLFWSDLADNQPKSEQHACLLQFVGVAEHLFSDEFGELITKEKNINELQIRRDEFLAMLQEVSREILDNESQSVALTPESISSAVRRVRDEIKDLHEQSETMLVKLRDETNRKSGGNDSILFAEEAERVTQLRARAESIGRTKAELVQRIEEMDEYRQTLDGEIGRISRAQVAGETLAGIKVTHCPACDQPVDSTKQEKGHCYVCHQQIPTLIEGSTRRLEFELENLKSERDEADELLTTYRSDLGAHVAMEKNLASELEKSESRLRPVQKKAASILPPDLTVINIRIGQSQEKLKQLQRIESAFAKREQLTQRIEEIENAVESLRAKVAGHQNIAQLDRAAQWISDGMNDYLTAINKRQPGAWPQKEVQVSLWDRNFEVAVGGGRWSAKLGGTLTLYFLISYHYGLLKLLSHQGCHYPGLLILDFPPELEDGSSVKDKENFVLEPFVELVSKSQTPKAQVIAAGSSFENLLGANRIELTRVWTDAT